MVDPITIASTCVNIGEVAYRISVTLYKFINETNNVDKTVTSLQGEVDSLARLLDSIATAVSNPIITSASAATPENVELLGSIGDVLASCRGTVDALAGVLQGVAKGSSSKSIFRRSVRAIRLNINSDDINRFRSRIQAESMKLQMALQMINL